MLKFLVQALYVQKTSPKLGEIQQEILDKDAWPRPKTYLGGEEEFHAPCSRNPSFHLLQKVT